MFTRIQDNSSRLILQSFFLIKLYLTGLFLFFICRIVFILSYGNLSELSEYKVDLLRSFITGTRFDTVVLTYSMLLLLALLLINIFLRAGQHIEQVVLDKVFVYFSVFALSFIVWICIMDFYFFKFFSSHINVAAFGIFDDDTSAILKSMWIDYPVIRMVIGMIIIVYVINKVVKSLYAKTMNGSVSENFYKGGYVLFFLGMFFMGMRCSFGNVPLEFMESSISSNSFINHIPMNGVFAIKNALEERGKGVINISESAYLSQFSYNSNEDIIMDYAKHALNIDSTNFPLDSLTYVRTSRNKFLEENPPNVVFLLMEGMSSYFFKLHSEKFNMLGSLEQELDKCIVFKNFTSCRNYTIFSMDGLIANSSLSPVSQSKYMNTSFPNSSIRPFVESGYSTEFITGGRSNWRNLDQFLPRQGFSVLEGGADIQKHNTKALAEHEWGVYDEFLMERVLQKLKDKKKTKPSFIYALTITNHTPFKAPDDYQEKPIEFHDGIKDLFNSTDEKTRETFVCYQYMCNSLGNFINEVSNSELCENTIIIATGDHSSHVADNLFGFTDKDFMDWYGVPLICYIPEKYKDALHIDSSRFGSHKDIFPTVYNMALSDTRYYNFGNNLFSIDTTTNYFGLYEYSEGLNEEGLVKVHQGGYTYFEWLDKQGGKLNHTDNPSAGLIELGNVTRASSAFNVYQTVKSIKQE